MVSCFLLKRRYTLSQEGDMLSSLFNFCKNIEYVILYFVFDNSNIWSLCRSYFAVCCFCNSISWYLVTLCAFLFLAMSSYSLKLYLWKFLEFEIKLGCSSPWSMQASLKFGHPLRTSRNQVAGFIFLFSIAFWGMIYMSENLPV